jgi:hypothetical protein
MMGRKTAKIKIDRPGNTRRKMVLLSLNIEFTGLAPDAGSPS